MKKMLPLIVIFVALIVMWSVYGNIMNSNSTATAVGGEYKVEIEEQALVIRTEVPVTVAATGYFQNSRQSQTKVYAGEEIGWFCKGEPDVDQIKQLNLINQKIREATLTSTTDEALTNDIFAIDNKILSYTKRISSLAAEGNQEEINKIRSEIDLLLERKENISSGSGNSKEDIIANLNEQRRKIEKNLGSAKQTLFAPVSGIFISEADGLEKSLTFDSVATLTPKTVREYLGKKEYKPNEEIFPYPVCRITDNSEWLLAVVCPTNKVQGLYEGKRVKISFPDEGDKTLFCTVHAISEEEKGEVVVYILGTNEIYNVLTARRMKIGLVTDSYEGLKVPASAVKNVGGKDTVTVVTGVVTEQTEVEVLFKDEDFAIIKEGGGLALYDEVKTK